MTVPTRPDGHEISWFGQPPGLTILFMTEMWEKFSYYGMRALLVLYMTKALAIPQARSSDIYGDYIMAAYLTPFLGAACADAFLGRRRAVLFGGVIMAAGHFMMAVPSLFYWALGTIALGNGFFLPNLPSQVRGLYEPHDRRLSSAYNVYYLGINLGAFLSALVCPILADTLGWHWGFAAAGVGMTLGVVIYGLGGRYLPSDAVVRERARAAGATASPVTGAGVAGRLLLLAGIVAVVVIFRGAYEQQGNTINLWADANVERPVLFGWTVPAAVFQSINPAVVILFTPVLVWWWLRRARVGREPGLIAKMATGAAITASAFVMVAAAAWLAEQSGVKTSWIWLAAFLILMTIGELYLLPVGLALFGRLAPERFGSLTIAIWFGAIALGSKFAGWLGERWGVTSHSGFFLLMAACALFSGALLLVFRGPVRKATDAAASGS